MRPLLALYVRITLFFILGTGCHETSAPPSKVHLQEYNIRVVNASFPLVLKGLTFSDFTKVRLNSSHYVHLNESVISYLKDAEISVLDTAVYKGTIRAIYDKFHFYLNIFKHPSGKLNANYLIIRSDTLFLKPTAYNIHAMYDCELNEIVPTNLYDTFMEDLPDAKLVQRNGLTSLQTIRLLHNGTYNALEVVEYPLEGDQRHVQFYQRRDTINLTYKNVDPEFQGPF